MSKRKGTPVVILAPRWKISELARMVRGDVKRGNLTPEQARRIIRDGKAKMVYTPPGGRRP